MKPLQTKMLAVLQETLEYYSDIEKFGFDRKQACRYFNPETGQMCAIGRCFKNPEKFSHTYRSVAGIQDHQFEFKPEYQNLPSKFWILLQQFHDKTAQKQVPLNSISAITSSVYSDLIEYIHEPCVDNEEPNS